MTKQILTLVCLLCFFVVHGKDEKKQILFKAKDKNDEFQFDFISKLQTSKSGDFITCNLRVKNTSNESQYIESISIEIEMEVTNLKNDSRNTVKQEFEFDQDWIVASEDFAFYQPKNKSLLNKDNYKVNNISSCKVLKIVSSAGTESTISSKEFEFNEKMFLGLVQSVLVKANFQKESDSSPGYYKNGLDLKSVGQSVLVHCTLNLNNSSNKAIKLKNDLTIGVKIGGKFYFKKLKAQKLKSKEIKTKNLFSVKLSNKLKSEQMKAGLQP